MKRRTKDKGETYIAKEQNIKDIATKKERKKPQRTHSNYQKEPPTKKTKRRKRPSQKKTGILRVEIQQAPKKKDSYKKTTLEAIRRNPRTPNQRKRSTTPSRTNKEPETEEKKRNKTNEED